MRYLEDVCQKKSITFDAANNHCRCIAHIMNLAVQGILKQIKAGEAESENTILDNMDMTVTTGDIIPKVIIYNILLKLCHYYISINYYYVLISFENL
jgi:hypothetical protein